MLGLMYEIACMSWIGWTRVFDFGPKKVLPTLGLVWFPADFKGRDGPPSVEGDVIVA